MSTVFVKNYPEPEININEILRYAKGADADTIKSLTDECAGRLSCKVCYMRLGVKVENGTVDLGFAVWESTSLARNLRDCDEIVIFGATIGIEFDRLIAKYSRLSPARAYILQGIGTERIESVCDMFERDIKCDAEKSGRFIRPRFSAGYGDFTLDAQRDIFSLLDAPRKIGLTLTDSLIMSPSKSVTAIIGISEKCAGDDKVKCASCGKSDCEYRGMI